MQPEKSILAPIKPYLKYALDMRNSESVVSYCCNLYFVEKGFSILKDNPTKTTPQMKTFLLETMKSLEVQKKEIGKFISFSESERHASG
jgi:hypothetical protein